MTPHASAQHEDETRTQIDRTTQELRDLQATFTEAVQELSDLIDPDVYETWAIEDRERLSAISDAVNEIDDQRKQIVRLRAQLDDLQKKHHEL